MVLAVEEAALVQLEPQVMVVVAAAEEEEVVVAVRCRSQLMQVVMLFQLFQP